MRGGSSAVVVVGVVGEVGVAVVGLGVVGSVDGDKLLCPDDVVAGVKTVGTAGSASPAGPLPAVQPASTPTALSTPPALSTAKLRHPL